VFKMNPDCSVETLLQKLQEPFSEKDIEWRVNRCGVSNGKQWAFTLAYLTNRAIQQRLDEVFGVMGWKNEYKEFQQGILCGISCKIEGEWVTKWDGAEQTNFEAFKGGLSGAMKRCAVQWGLGRYLYNLEEQYVEVFADRVQNGNYLNDKNKNIKGYWLPPKLPEWALPQRERKGNAKQNQQPSNSQNGNQQTQSKQNNNPKQKSPVDQRTQLVKAVSEYLVNTGFEDNKEYVILLFKQITPNITYKDATEVFQKATTEELHAYYKVLRPVNDLVNVANFYKISVEAVLSYVQILYPQQPIENLFNCFFKVKHEDVQEVVNMIKGDIANGHIQRTA
jgi:hypothetical protein